MRSVIANPKTSVTYYSTGGATNKNPYSKPMAAALGKLGITALDNTALDNKAVLPRKTGPGANALNGNSFRDQVIDRIKEKNPKALVTKEVVINTKTKTLMPAGTALTKGSRAADIVIKNGHWNPLSRSQVLVEAKDAYVVKSKAYVGQAKNYNATASAINSRYSVGVTNLKVGGALGVVGIGLTVAQLNAAYQADGKTFGKNTQRATAQTAGGWAGAWAGAQVGGALGGAGGAAFAGIGAVPGAIGGALVGAIAGGFGGGYAGDSAYSYFSSN